MFSPSGQTWGPELTSTRTVGVQIKRTHTSATLKFTRKMFVLFLMSFPRKTTRGTYNREKYTIFLLQTFFLYFFIFGLFTCVIHKCVLGWFTEEKTTCGKINYQSAKWLSRITSPRTRQINTRIFAANFDLCFNTKKVSFLRDNNFLLLKHFLKTTWKL